MDAKRSSIVVGASLAALVAGFFLRKKYVHGKKVNEMVSSQDVCEPEPRVGQVAKVKRIGGNGRHRVATN